MTRPLCQSCHMRQSYRDTQFCRQCQNTPVERPLSYDVDTDYLIIGPNWGRNTRLAQHAVKIMLPYGFEPEDRLRQVRGDVWFRVVRAELVIA